MRHTFAIPLFSVFLSLVAAPVGALPISAEVESVIAEMQAQGFAHRGSTAYHTFDRCGVKDLCPRRT